MFHSTTNDSSVSVTDCEFTVDVGVSCGGSGSSSIRSTRWIFWNASNRSECCALNVMSSFCCRVKYAKTSFAWSVGSAMPRSISPDAMTESTRWSPSPAVIGCSYEAIAANANTSHCQSPNPHHAGSDATMLLSTLATAMQLNVLPAFCWKNLDWRSWIKFSVVEICGKFSASSGSAINRTFR